MSVSSLHDEEPTKPGSDPPEAEPIASDPAWLRGRLLADEAVYARKFKEVRADIAEAKAELRAEILAVRSEIKSFGAQAPSVTEKYVAYAIATVMTVILGYLAKRVGLDLDPSQLPQLPR